jgi:hypothetical protein
MSLMGMVMIMCRSAYLEVDEYDDEENEKVAEDVEYSDEGEERVYAGKNHRTTDPDSASEENSYQQGSYISDDEDLFTCVGDSEEEKQQQAHQRGRIRASYVPSQY